MCFHQRRSDWGWELREGVPATTTGRGHGPAAIRGPTRGGGRFFFGWDFGPQCRAPVRSLRRLESAFAVRGGSRTPRSEFRHQGSWAPWPKPCVCASLTPSCGLDHLAALGVASRKPSVWSHRSSVQALDTRNPSFSATSAPPCPPGMSAGASLDRISWATRLPWRSWPPSSVCRGTGVGLEAGAGRGGRLRIEPSAGRHRFPERPQRIGPPTGRPGSAEPFAALGDLRACGSGVQGRAGWGGA